MSPSLLIVFSLAFLSSCRSDLVGEFCSQTKNPNTCIQIVRENPKSRGVYARGLAGIALEDALSFSNDAINAAKSEVIRSDDMKVVLNRCLEDFNIAVTALESCRPLINKRDGPSVATLRNTVSRAFTEISLCGGRFVAKGREQQKLKDAADKAYVFAQLLMVIADSR